jgi:hypothetical protein
VWPEDRGILGQWCSKTWGFGITWELLRIGS